MKKFTLTILITSSVLSLSAQNTWFKFVPGWRGNNCYILADTIYSFCPTSKFDKSIVLGLNINKNSLLDGEFYSSDSLFYYSDQIDELTNLQYRTKNNSIRLNNNYFLFAANYGDSVGSETKWQSDVFLYPSFEKLELPINYDTFPTLVEGLFLINYKKYALVNWYKKFDKLNTVQSSRLLKINVDNTTSLIYTRLNPLYSQSNHDIQLENIHADNQNPANLFLQILDRWDFAGDANQFEGVIQKIDTTGKLIWESRPVGDQDTINTTDFKMVQLPNGNILCSWLDLYYRPWKKPGDPYHLAESKDNATFWFAEIDYQTGKKLWTKNNRQFLNWKMGITDKDVAANLMTDALIFDDGAVWCGYRYINRPYPQNWTAIPYLFKTGFDGKPIWYREYNLWSTDTTDKGFKPYSFIRTPDNGFLLTGEYMRRWGVPSDTTQPMGVFQTAALLKLDSNGCFTPGCNATDNIIKIKVPENICQIYPNPAHTFLQIDYPTGSSGWEIIITDINGKEVFQTKETIHQISTKHLPNGIYYIQLTNKKFYHHETHKIIIQH
ncbi:MAG: T9SS type A sorting domain-containing protein [Bacteroidetes bacterium]|nr:T9SS type A sorting domain-containing protein [Bacteroidota bacterium]